MSGLNHKSLEIGRKIGVGFNLESNEWSRETWWTSILLSSIKELHVIGLITVLDDDETTLGSSNADLARVCNVFYSKLYSKPVPNGQQG